MRSILDVGCGPGQVALLLRDRGVENYLGLDFSTARVEYAKIVCPQYEFVVADAFKTNLIESHDYGCALVMEFLEHVERDLDVLNRVPPGKLVLATVPNFSAAGHVRHFNSVGEVEDRYAPCLHSLQVDAILSNPQGRTYYILQGRR